MTKVKAKIIGHRGAAGVALENTIESIKAGKEAGVDALEFDVRATKDGQCVVCHDPFLNRISDSSGIIKDLTYAELQEIPLFNGEHVPLLRDILKAAGETPVIVEIKVDGFTQNICEILDEFPELDITIASFNPDVISEATKLRPNIPAFVAEGSHPLAIIHIAKACGASGIDLNYKLLNPLTYWLYKRANLKVMVYTVDRRWIAWLIRHLYPTVWICTNMPQRFVSL